MKLLIWGNFAYPRFERAFADAWRAAGWEANEFSWLPFFRGMAGQAQILVPFPSPASFRSNAAFKALAQQTKPDVVLVWGNHHVFPSTFEYIKKELNSLLVSYNNDDPFRQFQKNTVPWHLHYMFYWFFRSLTLMDMVLVFRHVNVGESLASGAKRSAVMMPYFIPSSDRPIILTEDDQHRFKCDTVFVGHYEPDGREKYVQGLIKAGLHVRLFGGKYWTKEVLGYAAEHVGSVREALGGDYTKALCGAKMCLCFLSKWNRDTYTCRCFEIPASGALLVSERTTDLQRLFREDDEAIFFSSVDELVDKALWLRANPGIAQRIAAAGYQRVHTDGHSVNDRAHQFYEMCKKLRAGIL